MLQIAKNGTSLAALNLTIQDLDRRFGTGSVSLLNRSSLIVDVISTGFPQIDKAIGVGGLPRGRIVDIYGPEAAGKTTLCLRTIAQAQKLGGQAALIDTEHTISQSLIEKCKVNLDRLHLAQPTTGEEALEIVEAMVRAGAAVVVVDSVAGLLPRAELEGEMGDHHAGLQARLMSQAMRKLPGPVRENNTLLIFTNQIRYDPHAGKERPTGGMALRFHASVRIDLRRVTSIKAHGQFIGGRFRATIKKNKVAAPYRTADFEIMY